MIVDALHSRQHSGILAGEIGRSWLISAKIARKAGHWQTAYSAILQAQESRTTFSLMQKVRLIRATGEPLRALQELEHYLQTTRTQDSLPDSDVIDITEVGNELKQQKARASSLRCDNASQAYVSAIGRAPPGALDGRV
jgi:serine/threonine-protein kinase ATR